MIRVTHLWRHPIKSHGREALNDVTLIAGQTMPWDRKWAVTHAASKFDPDHPEWARCRNFMIGTSTPALAGLWATVNEATGHVTLRHADIGTLTFDPDDGADIPRFLAWVAALCPQDGPQPTDLVSVPDRGMTDTNYPTVSVMTQASHDAVASKLGHPLEPERWRGNIWLSGTEAWDERDWTGKSIQIGAAVLKVVEPIGRCKHTMANPVTGQRDADTLTALRDGWGHQDFGVYATVSTGGRIAKGDPVQVI